MDSHTKAFHGITQRVRIKVLTCGYLLPSHLSRRGVDWRWKNMSNKMIQRWYRRSFFSDHLIPIKVLTCRCPLLTWVSQVWTGGDDRRLWDGCKHQRRGGEKAQETIHSTTWWAHRGIRPGDYTDTQETPHCIHSVWCTHRNTETCTLSTLSRFWTPTWYFWRTIFFFGKTR